MCYNCAICRWNCADVYRLLDYFTPTHTHPHRVKKRSHSFTHTQPEKGHARAHPPTTSQKMVTPSQKKVTLTHNWKRECHVSNTYIREKYSIFTILADVFIFEIDWPVQLFLLTTFEVAFKSIACLFFCFQQIANYISENSKVKMRNVWNIFVFFHYVLLLLYKIIKHIMHSSQSSTRDSENNTK